MSTITLGLKSTNSETTNDFEKYTVAHGGNYNPYNQAFFDEPENMAVSNSKKQITSIPSPYARMHITELAFREYCCGDGIIDNKALQTRVLSADYRKAMSHCLDIFELIYYSDEINLRQIGISLHKIELVSKDSDNRDIRSLFANRPSLERYIGTLDLFRKAYCDTINKNKAEGCGNYSFDFTSLYLFKFRGETFAATSPFTGFYTKADCDLRKDMGSNKFEAYITVGDKKLLTNDENDWRGIAERDRGFKEFMYLLLKDTGLKFIFVELFKAITKSFDDTAQLDHMRFEQQPEYTKFNIGTSPLQKIDCTQDIFLRQDGIDCSYLKYLLYLAMPYDLTISEEEYGLDISMRRFPKNGDITPWIGVNDLLSDGLFVLPYEINKNYITIPYKDLDGDENYKFRCLLPIRQKALELFSLEQIRNMVTIVKKGGIYVVECKVPLENGGSTTLRKEYHSGSAVQYPNGLVVEGENMKPFAFGIYPFIRTDLATNIYKILFYNSFEDHPYHLNFYKKDANGNIMEYLQTEKEYNRTNTVKNPELPVNSEYHQLTAKDGLEMVELVVEINGKKVTSLIVPDLKTPQTIPGETHVAIDLGTSNTYVAYSFYQDGVVRNSNIHEINTHHVGINNSWNELTFMNEKCTELEDPNAPEKNREDIYLRESDIPGAKPNSEWLPTQLLEFIPSRIDPTLKDSYKFPIPSVINFLRQDSRRRGMDGANLIPLLNSAIPFAYYEKGTRKGAQPAYYDAINDGSDFKWYAKQNNGNYDVDQMLKQCFSAFMAELLFIVRSHLLSNGYPLDRCHLLWSYPLSFSPILVQEYEDAWKEAYRKYIHDTHDVDDFVKYTNESRTPIFECLTNPGTAADHLTILLDIGGGSTDVIGYKSQGAGNNDPLFITSFGFAGNSLYLGGSLNNMTFDAMQNSMLMDYVRKQPLFSRTDTGNGYRNVQIGLDRPISEIMNYGFSKDAPNFERLFKYNDKPQYMLLMHNAALIYHVAQLCKIKSPDEMPVAIYLTGNGSKLFNLNMSGRDAMIRSIFKYVYEQEGTEETKRAASYADNIELPNIRSPKAATTRGALKGMYSGQLATNNSSMSKQVVMLGDADSVYDVIPAQGGANIGNAFDIKSAVRPNVEAFIEMFYDVVYTSPTPAFSKDRAQQALSFIKDNLSIAVPRSGIISDSMFFQYIALLMQRISELMVNN